MCGIIGYVGKRSAQKVLFEGLKRLEYRGYDSAGIALLEKEICAYKAVGEVANLRSKMPSLQSDVTVGIAHTRWATHGTPSIANTHPHADNKKEIFVVHNGIIENAPQLKKNLQKQGYTFFSETDTEVIPHLIRSLIDTEGLTLEEAFRKALIQLEGTYGLAVLSKETQDCIFAARKGSPLILGVGQDEFIVASDISAFLPYTHRVVYLEDGEVIKICRDNYEITTLENQKITSKEEELNISDESIDKQGFAHYMLKEIHEQPAAMRNALAGRIILKEGRVHLRGLEQIDEQLQNINKVVIVSCGTSYYAGMVAKQWMTNYAGIDVSVEMASEYRYSKMLLDQKSLVIAISQSGETADTIAALKEAKQKGAILFGVINVVGSTIARMVDAGVYTHAGPEIGVASTKAFMTQLTALYLISVYLGAKREMMLPERIALLLEIQKLPTLIEEWLSIWDSQVAPIAKELAKYPNVLFLGRTVSYPIALEGALKLKEISYIHAEAYPSGEMKHGPIALIDEDFPSLMIAPKDSVYEKNLSNLEELKARSGKVFSIVTKGDTVIADKSEAVIEIPKVSDSLTPFVATVPLQLLAYHVAVLLDRNPDKPRNLAKSVTVE
jgi:glucosamine--fructose-6-phosphate aminotransferase (isomerizing)